MPNVHTVLKEEIARVARKELKASATKMKEDHLALKRSVSALKREVAAQAAEIKRLQKALSRDGSATVSASSQDEDEDEDGSRFWVTSNGIKSMRKKLRLTQAEFAELLGVSGQAVYQWEAKSGTLKVRSKTREAIIAVRKMGGTKEAKAALEEIRAAAKPVSGKKKTKAKSAKKKTTRKKSSARKSPAKKK